MSGIILWVNTFQAKRIMQKLVWCSLEEECMAPKGSIVKCIYSVSHNLRVNIFLFRNFMENQIGLSIQGAIGLTNQP
jgi:hypothetical protein